MTFEQKSPPFLALNRRVIHKIVKSTHGPSDLVCVFGQKAFNILAINSKALKIATGPFVQDLVELHDWIFDIYWFGRELLIVVCAHNQCILFDLKSLTITGTFNCEQACMLYIYFIRLNDFHELINRT